MIPHDLHANLRGMSPEKLGLDCFVTQPKPERGELRTTPLDFMLADFEVKLLRREELSTTPC